MRVRFHLHALISHEAKADNPSIQKTNNLFLFSIRFTLSLHPISKEEAMISIDGLAVEFGGTTLFSD
ncbi:hypothetical protein, partial [Bacteroides heparinolyticus]|uniref:hypothetical protein n=1 Tax=Prevotella heparinolytica TaxID=28113 RepID=UPI0035A09940